MIDAATLGKLLGEIMNEKNLKLTDLIDEKIVHDIIQEAEVRVKKDD